ncbi:hypothetical protein EDD27_9071 [Nonomuraea polychroma]|uniref:Uncharacterized protein n=1 Tax=Nonomuraea polychroma TaxID=46176 RepID=A0A438MKC9_9ACTN|nr:hypothetical protein [Nonomuraea polychroma]RVX46213.1 hypothetical protein EDD27_9071 [Nonomuraea polychroma]
MEHDLLEFARWGEAVWTVQNTFARSWSTAADQRLWRVGHEPTEPVQQNVYGVVDVADIFTCAFLAGPWMEITVRRAS